MESGTASYDGAGRSPAAAGSIPKTLFMGYGATAVGWYRCYMPATFLGCDWIGVMGDPPKLNYVTGLVGGQTTLPNFLDYEVIVMQQPRGKGWLQLVRNLQEKGIKVVYEIDDYIHAISKMADHDFNRAFAPDELRRFELVMRVCDAMIVSTPFIRTKYRAFNKHVHVCRNGIDPARYDLTRPPRPTVNIGWAGGTGHHNAALPWIQQVPEVMREYEDTCFVSIGQDFADPLSKEFGMPRALSVPFTAIETYPAAMTLFDIALAPAGKNLFFRGKSDLRWLEAGALGVPVIADPFVYSDIEDGVDGFWAETPDLAGELLGELIGDESLRLEVGANAQARVLEERSMSVMAEQWAEVLRSVAG